MNIIINYFINIVESILFLNFITKYLIMNKKYNLFIGICFIIIFSSIISVMNYFMIYEGVFAIVYIMVFYFFSIKFSQNNWKECLSIGFLIDLMVGIINIFVVCFFSIYLFGTVNLNKLVDKNSFVIIIIITKVLLYFISILVLNLRKKIHIDFTNQELWILLITLMGLYFLFIPIEYYVFENKTSEVLILSLLLILYLLIIILFFVFGYIIKLREEKNIINNNLKLKEFEIQQLIYLREKNNIIVSLKHDIKHLMISIYGKIESGKISEIKSILDEYNSPLDELVYVENTSNETLNCLLIKYKEFSIKKNIEFKYIINSKCKFELTDLELAVLLGNILDNAFENCSGDNKIILKIVDKEEFTLMKITNSISLNPNENICIETSKKNDHMHGFGIKSIRSIIEKYNYKIIFNNNSKRFNCIIYLKKSNN